jgi:hypothetical protein
LQPVLKALLTLIVSGLIIVTICRILINVFYLKWRLIRMVKIKEDVDSLFSTTRIHRLAQENGAERCKALLSIEQKFKGLKRSLRLWNWHRPGWYRTIGLPHEDGA